MDIKEHFDYEYHVNDVHMPCIYFLVKEGNVVYVGQSRRGLFRILQHVNQKDFDEIKIKKCNAEDLDELEMAYIVKYNPKHNKQLSNAYNCESLKRILRRNGYRIRKNVIRKWVLSNVEGHFMFRNEVYVSEKDIDFTLNGIMNTMSD